MNDKKTFAEKIGYFIGMALWACVAACIITIMLAFTIKFMIWIF